MGGSSSEREISLKSGQAIYNALSDAGCKVKALDIISNDEDEIFSFIKDSNIDIAFIALHGRLGEDGTIQTILQKANVPYTGSGINASRLALNKALSQEIFRQKDIRIPDYIVLSDKDSIDIDGIVDKLNSLPVVVKPCNEGSSLGITVVTEKKDLRPAISAAFKYGCQILVEDYIPGRELTVGVLGNTPLPVVEIQPKNSFFDFEAKYQKGMTDYIVPAQIPPRLASVVKEMAVEAHFALSCCDFSRADFIIDEKQHPYILEVNTIPGFTETSLFPKAAKAVGLDFTQLCLKLIQLAYEKKK